MTKCPKAEVTRSSSEDVRDGIRSLLHAHSPNEFPWGQVGASVGGLAITMLKAQDAVSCSQLRCTSCDYEGPEVDDRLGYAVCATEPAPASTSQWIGGLGQVDQSLCPQCMSPVTRNISYRDVPSLLSLEYPDEDIRTSHRIILATDDGHVPLYLRGIIYSGRFHFTARIIHPDGNIWYHDGQKGHLGEKDGSLKSKNDKDLRSCRGRKLVLAIYAQE